MRGPQVGQLPQKLQGVPLLLQRVFLRVGAAQYFQAPGDYLVLLAATEGFLQYSEGGQAASGGQVADEGVIGAAGIDDDLQVRQARPVVDLDKGNAAGGSDSLNQPFTATGLGASSGRSAERRSLMRAR